MKLYFSEVFEVSAADLEAYGAFDVSLVVDLPLFVDPFLLFHSSNETYKALHETMIEYLRYLRNQATEGKLDEGRLKHLFCFPEVGENWFGFALDGNRGRGLGMKFARALAGSLETLFRDFGKEQVTRGSHLEKLVLLDRGVGRDMISDFTTNLIKGFLCSYTQEFAQKYINPSFLKKFAVSHSVFNYDTGHWMVRDFVLPKYKREFVLLTPENILTKDETWINKQDFYQDYFSIPEAIGDVELRSQIDAYFQSVLPRDADKRDRDNAIRRTAVKHPELFDYFIRRKEDTGSQAELQSLDKVGASIDLYVKKFGEFVRMLEEKSEFFKEPMSSYEAAREKAQFLKDVIENKGGYRLFYVHGKPIEREHDLQILYRLVWHRTGFDVSREVNDGRGPADFKVSKGAHDKTLVEMKLASNSALRRNLENQAEIYRKASDAQTAIKVIIYFTDVERKRLDAVLGELKLSGSRDIVLIDARSDNKPSGSKA